MKTLFLTLAMIALVPAARAGVQCDDARWTQEPKITDGLFTAAIVSDCTVTAEDGGGLAKLDQYLLAETVKEEVLGGPFAETFQDLPSVRYDIRSTRTIESVFGTDTVSVRSDARVATDRRTKLLQEAVSKEISGTGNFQYMRKLDYGVRVFPVGDGTYKVEVWNVLHVKKPSLVPSGFFRDKVAEAMANEFRKTRDARLAPFPAHL